VAFAGSPAAGRIDCGDHASASRRAQAARPTIRWARGRAPRSPPASESSEAGLHPRAPPLARSVRDAAAPARQGNRYPTAPSVSPPGLL